MSGYIVFPALLELFIHPLFGVPFFPSLETSEFLLEKFLQYLMYQRSTEQVYCLLLWNLRNVLIIELSRALIIRVDFTGTEPHKGGLPLSVRAQFWPPHVHVVFSGQVHT